MALMEAANSPLHHRNPRGQGERLHDEILDAADMLLAQSGDATTLTLRRVARHVGIAATSIYLHFSTVDDLKTAVVERGYAELNAARDAASQDISEPREALLARMRAYAHFAVDYPGRYQLMFGSELPATLAYAAEQSPGRQALQSLISSIRRCQDGGFSSASDDPSQVAIMVWTAVHGLVLLHIHRPSFPWTSLDDMVNEMVRRIVGFDLFESVTPC